jgi:hypothetical protein
MNTASEIVECSIAAGCGTRPLGRASPEEGMDYIPDRYLAFVTRYLRAMRFRRRNGVRDLLQTGFGG